MYELWGRGGGGEQWGLGGGGVHGGHPDGGIVCGRGGGGGRGQQWGIGGRGGGGGDHGAVVYNQQYARAHAACELGRAVWPLGEYVWVPRSASTRSPFPFRVHEVAWDCIADRVEAVHEAVQQGWDELKADRAEADTDEPVSHSYRCLHCNIDMGVGGPHVGPRPRFPPPPTLPCRVCSASPFCSQVCVDEHLRDSCAVPHWFAEGGATHIAQINDTCVHSALREEYLKLSAMKE